MAMIVSKILEARSHRLLSNFAPDVRRMDEAHANMPSIAKRLVPFPDGGGLHSRTLDANRPLVQGDAARQLLTAGLALIGGILASRSLLSRHR